MPRKAAATKDVAPAAVAAEEPAADAGPRRSGRTKPASAAPAAPVPAKKPKAKRAAAKDEEGDNEEPAAKKAKPISKAASIAAVEAEIKVDASPDTLAPEPPKQAGGASRSKPASKASNAAGAKPVSKASNAGGAKPASSRGKAPKPAAAAAEAPADNDVEMEDKENVKADVKGIAAQPEAEVAELQIGDTLPEWTFKNEKEEDVNIAELAKDKGLVFFLVPKADTPGCTTQACGFRDSYADFEKYGYAVYGLSADASAAQSKWQSKKNLPYSLISDPQRKLIQVLGAKSGSSTKRSHMVFEKGSGKLVDRKLGVKPADSSKQALEFIKAHYPETS